MSRATAGIGGGYHAGRIPSWTRGPDRPHAGSVTAALSRPSDPSGASTPPDRATAIAAVATAVLFTGAFTLLGVTFDYPAVLDEGAGEILTRYAAADGLTRTLWYVMMIASLAFVPLAVLLGRSVGGRLTRPSALGEITVVVGVLAALVQAVGFARWTFAVPYLAETYVDPSSSPATRDSVVVAFEVLHRFVGGALGEHLGFALTAVWTVCVAVLLAQVPGSRGCSRSWGWWRARRSPLACSRSRGRRGPEGPSRRSGSARFRGVVQPARS